jgi:hypothetical protein
MANLTVVGGGCPKFCIFREVLLLAQTYPSILLIAFLEAVVETLQVG